MAGELPAVPRLVLNPYLKPDTWKLCDETRVNQTPYTRTEIATMAEALRTLQPGVAC